MEEPLRYQFPDDHDQALKTFSRIMLIGGLVLLLAGGSFFYFADSILVRLPFSTEKALVRPYEKLLSRYWPQDDTYKDVEDELKILVDNLSEAMELPEDITLSVHYVDDDTVNAFAMLGGHIIVFRGLLESLPNENALAMVLAHEIAHIKNRDPLVALGRGVVLQLAYGLITGNTGYGGEIFEQSAQVGLLAFSREQELAADSAAIATLQAYYGHVSGATTFFENMHAREQDTPEDELPDWLSTHPDLEERIDKLEALIQESGWEKGIVKPLPQS